MNSWGNFFLVLSLIPAIAFPFIYGFTATWWKTALGRSFMYTNATLFLLYGLAGVGLALGDDYPGKGLLTGLLYFMAFTFLWVQSISYVIAWLHTRKEKRSSPKE